MTTSPMERVVWRRVYDAARTARSPRSMAITEEAVDWVNTTTGWQREHTHASVPSSPPRTRTRNGTSWDARKRIALLLLFKPSSPVWQLSKRCLTRHSANTRYVHRQTQSRRHTNRYVHRHNASVWEHITLCGRTEHRWGHSQPTVSI